MPMSFHPVVVKIFSLRITNAYLLALEISQGNTCGIYPHGTMNVHTKCHSNEFHSFIVGGTNVACDQLTDTAMSDIATCIFCSAPAS